MTLHEFNILSKEELRKALTRCCGSLAWVEKMLPHVPAEDMVELLEDAEIEWANCTEDDWKEAFAAHPKIGDPASLAKKFASTTSWANDEQKKVGAASEETLHALAVANKLYEKKFGYIFIVCATGKSAEEILGLLHVRLQNKPGDEMRIAADEQNNITKLRIEKLLE
jgi:2-oxo-4-hydroxy-4-carboxy-5-ureidoimidazoline decarboxylase